MNPEIIYSFFAAILVVGLLYFMLFNAVNNSNYMKKGLIFLVFGILLFGATAAGIIYDVSRGLTITLKYLAFPIVNILFTIVFAIINFTSAIKYNHGLSSFKKVVNNKITNYLYLVVRYEDFYLLDGKDSLKGLVIKFDKDTYYHDDMINRFLKETKTEILKKQYVGRVIIADKKEQNYYCYKLEIMNIPNSLSNLEQVNKFEIYQKSMTDFDKEIILKMLITDSSNPFTIRK